MYRPKIGFTESFIEAFFLYLIFSLTMWDLNPFNWMLAAKILLIAIYAFSIFMAIRSSLTSPFFIEALVHSRANKNKPIVLFYEDEKGQIISTGGADSYFMYHVVEMAKEKLNETLEHEKSNN